MGLGDGGRRALEALVARDATERTAALTSTASIGGTFGPGLLPRTAVDQAVITGVVAAVNYGLVTTTQSFIQGATAAVLPERAEAGTYGPRIVEAAANGALIVGGAALARALPQRPGEPVKRAFLRTAGNRLSRGGYAGLMVAGTLLAGDLVSRRGGRWAVGAAVPGGFVIGAAFAAEGILRYRKGAAADVLPPAVDPLPLPEIAARQAAAAADADLADARTEAAGPPWPPPLVKSIGLGLGISGLLHLAASGETHAARLIGRGVTRVVPGAGRLGVATGHAVMLGGLTAAVAAGMEYLYQAQDRGGAAIEQAYESAPAPQTVSGGPESAIDWRTLSREGARFVNMVLSPEEISEVTGVEEVMAPIRAFVGLDSAETVDARVDLVMTDLETMGAFDRSLIVVASPTGSGYVNYVAAETVEYLTRGDCAIVSMQYSQRPSFLSLDRVALARDQNRALLHALTWRLRAIPQARRPRVVGFGESLGAHTLQDAFLHEGVAGFHRAGMDRALFLGTPAGSKWAKTWRLRPERSDPDGEVVEVASIQEWEALDAERRARARYVLLSHHEDPIVKFEPALIVQQPPWLDPEAPRPPGVPRDAEWRPITTFMTTLVDVKNAMSVEPGTFVARGHDYRAGLAGMVSVAYDLPVELPELLRIEAALRRRELHWAADRLVAEQVAQARDAVARQLKSWGVSGPAAEVTLSQAAG